MNVPGTIAHTTVVRADALAVGDVIPGGDAVNGHRVEVVTPGRDRMLGQIIRAWVREEPRYRGDATVYPILSYIFRPSDRLHVER